MLNTVSNLWSWKVKFIPSRSRGTDRKTLTTKDLTKPWAFLATIPSHTSSLLDTPPLLPLHSARTTLLLDDSPHKAPLQPHNHVCVSEYDAFLRSADLRVWEAQREFSLVNRIGREEIQWHSVASEPTPLTGPGESQEEWRGIQV